MDFTGSPQNDTRHRQQRRDFCFGSLTLFVQHGELLFKSGDFELGFEHILLEPLADRVSIARDLLEPAEQVAVLARQLDRLLDREPLVPGNLQPCRHIENHRPVVLLFALGLAFGLLGGKPELPREWESPARHQIPGRRIHSRFKRENGCPTPKFVYLAVGSGRVPACDGRFVAASKRERAA